MNESEYFDAIGALREHLTEVRPIFDDFCVKNAFLYVPQLSIGRYPRIRIARERSVGIYFDLWMELDENGRRFEIFNPHLPYSLYAGAYITENDGSKYGVRYSCDITCFSGKPFKAVGAVLLNEMEKQLPILEGWDIQYLKDNGNKVQLGV